MNKPSLMFGAIAAGLLLCLSAPSVSAADDTDLDSAQLPVIHFRNGDYLTGRPIDSEDAHSFVWQSAAFTQPLRLAVSGVQWVQLPRAARPNSPPGPYCFELTGGDTLSGELISLDDREAVLKVAGLGTLHVERAALCRFYRASTTDLIFAGPGSLEGWKATGPDKAWREVGGQLKTDLPGATLRRDFRPPPFVRYEIELSWNDQPNFELAASLDEDSPANRAAFRLETWGDELVISREADRRADLQVLQKLGPGSGHVHLQILFDQPHGRVVALSAAGAKLADLTVPDEKSGSLPTFTKGKPGMLLRAPTNKPVLPGGFQLSNRGSNIKLDRLTISRWSGVAPEPPTGGRASIQQIDGTIRSAEVRSFDAAARQLVLAIDGAVQRLDERQLQDVVLLPPEASAPPEVRALLASGARLSGALSTIQSDRITLQCPSIHEPLTLPLNELQALLVLQADNPRAGEILPPTESREGRLEIPGLSLRGSLVSARTGEQSCLVFRSKFAVVASPLSPDVSGRLIFREPPPTKPEPAPEAQQPVVMRAVNGVRTLLGVRHAPAQRPAPPGDCVLHLRSGDTLPCRDLSIDERGVSLQSPITDARFVPHDRIKALELRPDSPAVKIEKTKADRLLTLPRMQRDNPPEQLIRSLEGDYLRGRLLALDDKQLTVEVRLETKTLDRTQVARIIWLHRDEELPPPASSGDLPAGTRVQAVPRGGNRLTFFAQQFDGDTLSGQSEVLGACRVKMEQVDQLLIGKTIEQAAATLAFHQWRLRPAADPLPAPEEGADPNGGAGMESVLVGKPAPPIELDLLDGKKFRLADLKNKIVVLDFWASWCGPCLQAMPLVDKVAHEFAAEDVQLVAINLQETPERIRTALARLNLETAVALDQDGRVAERYGANAIPQTVIIDKGGNVARLFVGGGPRFDEQLRLALKSVLGKAANPGPAGSNERQN